MDSIHELILQAVYNNDLHYIKCNVTKAININKICSNGMTLMGVAAQTGNLPLLQTLIEQSSQSVELFDSKNDNKILDTETRKKNVGFFVIRHLDEQVVDLGDGPTPEGMEELEWDMEVDAADDAVEDSQANIYKWYAKILNRTSVILDSPDLDMGRLDRHGQSVLHYAVNSGNVEMVDYLLKVFDKDLNPNQLDTSCFSPLHMAAANGSTEMVKFLLLKGANINALGGRFRQSVVHVAARGGHAKVVKLLIDAGVDVNTIDVDERTPLTAAARVGSEECVRLLIKAGSRINHEELGGVTALQMAVWSNQTAITKDLLQAGARFCVSHRLLHIAVNNNCFENVKNLVERGANVNAKDEQGFTPLMYCCSRKNIQMMRYLLVKGADPNSASQIDYRTALHICVQDVRDPKSAQQTVDLLVKYGADLNASSLNGTVLFYSMILENKGATIALIRNGAAVNLKDERSYVDNLSVAKRHGDLDIVRLLVFAGFNVYDMVTDLENLRTSPNDPSYDFLLYVKTNPLSLRERCRIVIRNKLGGKALLSKIRMLPLPPLIQSYLSLEIL